MSSILTNQPSCRNLLHERAQRRPIALGVAVLLASTCMLGTAKNALAQGQAEKDCPPGSWFCGETAPPPAGANKELQPLPPEKPAPPPPPPVVVYQPPAPVIVQAREAPPRYYYVPRQERRREWGLNLHIGGLMIGSANRHRDHDTGMAMIGLGLRYRPIPALAIEADLDFASGRDYNAYRRRETALTFNGLVFLNPKSKTQVYLLGGVGWSAANAVNDAPLESVEYRYGYFGGQAGIGLEFRVSKLIALNFDLRGFMRTRIDSRKDDYAEFVGTNGRTTNTSGGGILQGGLTFYW